MTRPRLSKAARTQVKRIRQEMKAFGIRLRVFKSAVIRADGDECSGYFDPERMMVAIGSKESEAEFMAVLCHEFTHFLQWRDHLVGRNTRHARAWRNNINTEGLGDKGLSRRERYDSYRALLELERQAEVGAWRAVEQGAYGTELERERLVKAAALYLYCHRLMYEKRRWFREGKGDLFEWLEDPRIWAATPTTLRGVDFNRIPRPLRALLKPLF
jgi:hypothetical protein